MSKKHAPRSIVSIFSVMAALLFCAWGANVAHADSIGGQISIAPNGQAMVRNAAVVSVDGSGLTVSTSWGATTLFWRVVTTGSTEFFPSETSHEVLDAIKPGDTVSLTGTLVMSTTQPTIRASVLRDSSLENDSAQIGGTIGSIDTTHNAFALSTDTATVTVKVKTGTVITRDGDPITLSDLAEGERVSIFGVLNLMTHTMIAGKITDASSTEGLPVTDAAPTHAGFFSRFLSWLRASTTGGEVTIK